MTDKACDHCSYCGARLDIGPPNHICKEITYGTAVTPTSFIPMMPTTHVLVPGTHVLVPAAYRPKKIWAKEILDAIEHGRPL